MSYVPTLNTARTASNSTDWKSDQDRFDAAAKVQPTCWDEPDKFGYWRVIDLRPKPHTKRISQRGDLNVEEPNEPTGSDFTLANSGLTKATTESAPAEPATYGPGIKGAMDAANDLTRERGSSETEPVERFLEYKTGSRAGERVDLKKERMSLTPEAAARTLTDVHRAETELELRPQLIDLADAVDDARLSLNADGQPKQPQQTPPVADATPAQPDAPQPESGSEPSTPGMDPDFAALLERKPQLRQQLQAEYGAVEQARQQYTNATAQIANVLVAELASDLPEIVALPPEQRGVGLQILQQQQPERFAAVQAKAARIQAVVSAQQQNAAIAAQQNYEQFKQWSKAQDDALLAKAPELAEDKDLKASKASLKTLKDAGFDEREIATAWNGGPISLRDHRAQLVIWKAAQYDMAKAGIGRPEPKGLPPVQRPGIAPSAGERSTVDLSDLRSQFRNATGQEQLRLGAKLTRLQRESRR